MNRVVKISDEEYFKSEGLSNSFLIRFDRSPAHAFTDIVPTESMKTGTLFHTFILEPQIFDEKYVIAPDTIPHDRRTSAYKEFAKSQTKEILFESDIAHLRKVKDHVHKYMFEGLRLSEYLRASDKEISLFWDLYIDGKEIQCKAKFDMLYIHNDSAIIFDLKKVTNCLEFPKSVVQYKYYRQANFYRTGLEYLYPDLKQVRFIFITVEDSAPYGVLSYELNDEYLFEGEKETFRSIMSYLVWDGNKDRLYENRVVKLNMPDWFYAA